MMIRRLRSLRWCRSLGVVVAAAVLTVLGATPALAYEPVNTVHTEHVQAGPYGIDVGFSVWPVRSLQSLDMSFVPEGGIADKQGTLAIRGPGEKGKPKALVRHPRRLDVWGLDTTALDDPGTYSLDFSVDGPLGHGEGRLPELVVLDQPGPPLGVSWTLGALPLVALVAFLAIAWRRTRPGSHQVPV